MHPSTSTKGLSQQVSGPRAKLRNQQYREIAEKQLHAEREKFERHNDSANEVLESTSMSAQAHAINRIVRPSCLNVSSEEELKNMPGKDYSAAVTYWSHELKSLSLKPNFPATPLKRGSPLFAKCTEFTNDITDSRIRHSDDVQS